MAFTPGEFITAEMLNFLNNLTITTGTLQVTGRTQLNTATATTPSQSDNSSSVATTAWVAEFVTSAIAAALAAQGTTTPPATQSVTQAEFNTTLAAWVDTLPTSYEGLEPGSAWLDGGQISVIAGSATTPSLSSNLPITEGQFATLMAEWAAGLPTSYEGQEPGTLWSDGGQISVIEGSYVAPMASSQLSVAEFSNLFSVFVAQLPTSAQGLAAGSLFLNGDVLSIVQST